MSPILSVKLSVDSKSRHRQHHYNIKETTKTNYCRSTMANISTDDEIEISFTNHDWKLGFSITLGFGSQKARGDDGIYINSIEEGSPIALDGRIWVGDRITGVRNSLDGERVNLNGIDYETSVTILKKA